MWNRIQFFVGVSFGFAICALLWAMQVNRLLGYRAEGEAINVSAWYDKKVSLAEKMPSPRIILVGGSNAFYGLSARKMAEGLNVPVLNFGTHGGLTLHYLLFKAREVARPGDLIVLVLEYEMYRRADALNATAINYYLGGDPQYIKHLPLSQMMQCYFTPDIASTFSFRPASPKTYRDRLRRVDSKIDQIINDHGDRIGHSHATRTEKMWATVSKLEPLPSLSVEDLTEVEFAWRQLASFREWCAGRQITLTATYPNTIDHPVLHQPAAQENLAKIRSRYEAIGVPVIGNGNEALRPRDDFYDTIYHLSQEGQEARTAEFIEIIRPLTREWQERGFVQP